MKLCFIQCIYCFQFSDSLPDVDCAEKLVSAAPSAAFQGCFVFKERSRAQRRATAPHRSGEELPARVHEDLSRCVSFTRLTVGS